MNCLCYMAIENLLSWDFTKKTILSYNLYNLVNLCYECRLKFINTSIKLQGVKESLEGEPQWDHWLSLGVCTQLSL